MLESVKNGLSLVVCALAAVGYLHAQSERCPILAKLPADLKDSAAAEERLWFELRQCNGEMVVVNAYERQNPTPSLTVKTGYTYPALLSHTFNILVLESLGGSANHITVITFQNGKPSVALERSAGGQVQLRRTEDNVIVTVPPKTYPDPDGKFPKVPNAVYTFRLEY